MSQFERFPKSRAVLEKGVRDGVAPGFVAGFWSAKEPERFEICAVGSRRLKWKGFPEQPMEMDTIFDLASITKVISTAPMIAQLVERGWLSWETPIQSIFPSFKSKDILIKHLLSHTSGLVAWLPFYEILRKELAENDQIEFTKVSDRQESMRDLILDLPAEVAPGTRTLYSDPNFLLLGYVIEALTDLPLDAAVKRYLWEPMGLTSPHFIHTVDPAFHARRENYAATEDCPWRGAVLQGQVHDDNCWAMGGYAGHAGVFSNIRDVLQYGKMLCEGEYFSHETRKAMWSLAESPVGSERTLGWDTPSGERPAFSGFSRNSVGHLGFTGTSFWIDLDNRCVVALLSNRVHPSRDNGLIKNFRPLFHETLAEEMRTSL